MLAYGTSLPDAVLTQILHDDTNETTTLQNAEKRKNYIPLRDC